LRAEESKVCWRERRVADALLEIEGLSKRFGGIVGSDAISLAVPRGELHAIIGPNGAGKTTLIGQLAGEMSPDAGNIRFDGRDITALPVYRRSQLGLARSFQISSLFLNFTALDNVALAVQAHAGHSFYFWRNARCEADLRGPARLALARVGLADRGDVLVSKLSHGEHRQLEIAMALATTPRMLLLDEPMAGMGPEESARMVDLLRKLKGELTILLIEHDMEAVFALADRITVLVYGRIIASGSLETIRAKPISASGRRRMADAALLEVADIDTCYDLSQVLFGMSLTIAPGEVVALMGRNGMGKTTTVRSIMGLTPATKGSIRFNGREIRGLPAYQVAKLGIGLVPEGRQVFPNLTTRENLVATAANRSSAAEPWTLDKVYTLFPRLAERTATMASQLSGGEQQMLVIGRALMTNPRLLILDEATEGLAPLLRAEIWQCLTRLKAAGQSILVIDKTVEALIGVADRHYVVERGTVVWAGSSKELAASPAVQRRYLGV
jgi:branched-chain amino acid transport system ATP-binding protein